MLERIIRYEAVHEIQGWDDLRRRVQPSDRRCFGFFHPSLIDEPLIFVEVALTREIPASIQSLLAEERAILPAKEATTAVFYSISNCQQGLRGVSFGNFLIKQVVEELSRELPGLQTFVTLSPAPGFAGWLDRVQADPAAAGLAGLDLEPLQALRTRAGTTMRRWPSGCKPILLALAATYYLRAKGGGGKPIDPVARFHLGNGARLERLNWLGDISPKGLREAHGLMVNYLYDLRFIEANHEAFANEGTVVACESRPATPACDPACPGDRRMNENLFEIFRRSFPADLGRVFLERPDGSVLSYADLLDLSGRVAQVLKDLGVKPGDRVAAQVEKSAEALMVYLGALRAGAVYLPLNTAYTAGEVRYFLGDAEPTLFVCRPGARRRRWRRWAAELGVPHVLTLGEHGDGSLWAKVPAAVAGDVDVPRGKDDLAAFLYTSGTTGPLQGCHAQPRQPRLQRGDAARCLAVHRRRPAAARAADLPHPRPVRRHQHHADGRRLADLSAALRPRRHDAAAAEGDRR